MKKGEDYIINYTRHNKNILATFLEEEKDIYIFKNIHGVFGITRKSIADKLITLELIED